MLVFMTSEEKTIQKVSLSDSVKEMVGRLCKNKKLPKYQFERCADVFISLFLGDWLKKLINEIHLDYAANEFPFIKPESHQSTNIDYVFIGKNTIYLIELKTDKSSYRNEQIENYGYLKTIDKFKEIREPIKRIKSSSRKSEKYEYLLTRFDGEAYDEMKVEIIFITPSPKPKALDGSDWKWHALEDFISCKDLDTPHQELWKIIQPELRVAFGG